MVPDGFFNDPYRWACIIDHTGQEIPILFRHGHPACQALTRANGVLCRHPVMRSTTWATCDLIRAAVDAAPWLDLTCNHDDTVIGHGDAPQFCFIHQTPGRIAVQPFTPDPDPLVTQLPRRGWGVYTLLDATGRVLWIGFGGAPRLQVINQVAKFGDRIASCVWRAFTNRFDALAYAHANLAVHFPHLDLDKVR